MKLASRIAGLLAPPVQPTPTVSGEIGWDSARSRWVGRDSTAVRDFLTSADVTNTRGTTVPAVRVQGTGQSVGTGLITSVPLLFSSEDFDTDGMHDLVSNTDRLTANTAGIYDVSGYVQWPTAAGSRYLFINQYNSANVLQRNVALASEPSPSAFNAVSASGPVSMAAGDFLRLEVLQDSGAPQATTKAYLSAVWQSGTGTTIDRGLLTVSIPFTDGDTVRRVSIADSNVSVASKVSGTIRRPDIADDSADRGYLYIANVVRVYAGGFDLLVAATAWGFDDTVEVPPNETIQFTYVIG